MGKNYLSNNKINIFKGFKNIFWNYKNGYKTKDDIFKDRLAIINSPTFNISAENIYQNISYRYSIILKNIDNGRIQFDKQKVIKSIRNDIEKDKNNLGYKLVDDNIVTGNFLIKNNNYVNELDKLNDDSIKYLEKKN